MTCVLSNWDGEADGLLCREMGLRVEITCVISQRSCLFISNVTNYRRCPMSDIIIGLTLLFSKITVCNGHYNSSVLGWAISALCYGLLTEASCLSYVGGPVVRPLMVMTRVLTADVVSWYCLLLFCLLAVLAHVSQVQTHAWFVGTPVSGAGWL